MNKKQASELIQKTFPEAFDKAQFHNFVINVLNRLDESKAKHWSTQYVKDAFKAHVHRYERLGTYTSPDEEKVDVLIVYLTAESKLERARTAIRNFVADHLKARDEKDAALVAFVSPTGKQWRLSYVKMEYATVEKESGMVGVETRLTPARRFSYLVGEGESCHTAESRFLDLLQDTATDPALAQIEEAFSVEAVTKEFFAKYAEHFGDINAALEKLVAKGKTLRDEFNAKGVNTVDFAKKLMGQIVFLYFLQKKGWLGVEKGKDWGTGPRDFLRRLANGDYGKYDNFFNDILEPLFYDALATDRGDEAWCSPFKCRIPFLDGGLFEPLGDYEWKKTDIILPNELFANDEYVEEGVTGTGVFDMFDRYNFTVNESEPLEKEVAIDPEMLGKVFENLIEENRRKGLGAFYTPREIVHYMCQESLINYLDTAVNRSNEIVPRAEIETFIRLGEQLSHYESVEAQYAIKMPKSIEKNAMALEDALKSITVCDPAVGSGAFPVGMMTEIVRARAALTPYFNDVGKRTSYHFKRHAIQNCIYGVDIDSSAVEIAKLRLWLSLVVDEEDVKKVEPLPNLDYKVVCGNSLLGFPFKSQRIQELENLREKFFSESEHAAKAKLKSQIDSTLAEAIAASKRSLGYEITFDFETWFSEVFRERGGFDVVIANPPYVDSETMVRNDPEGRALIAGLYETTRGNWDLYIPFWELGLKKLSTSGTATFITPNKWLSIRYGKALRTLATQYAYHLVDYSRFRAFEQVGVFPVVMLMSKRRPSVLTVRRFMEDQRLVFEQRMPSKRLEDFENWGVFLSPHFPLVVKVAADHAKVSNLCEVGEPFTVSEAYQVTKLIEEWTPAKKDTLKFVNTGTIDPYVNLWGQKQTTYLKVKYSKPVLNTTRFKRAFPRRFAQSTSAKIIISGIRHFESFLDKDGEYVAGKSTVILRGFKAGCSPECLLGILNSTLVKFYLQECYGSLAMDGGINFSPYNVSEIPVANAPQKKEREIEDCVKQILAAKHRNPDADTSALQHEIDKLVYEIYGLTPEEIKIVEGKA